MKTQADQFINRLGKIINHVFDEMVKEVVNLSQNKMPAFDALRVNCLENQLKDFIIVFENNSTGMIVLFILLLIFYFYLEH